MYKHVVATLDGSALAEIALPHALALAQQAAGAITLLRVLPPLTRTIPEGVYVDWDQIQRDLRAEARAYLDQMRDRLAAEGVTVRAELREGEPAHTVVEAAHELGADIIVMATHGRSGVGRWVLGSVADRVVRAARMPVLLIRPAEVPPE